MLLRPNSKRYQEDKQNMSASLKSFKDEVFKAQCLCLQGKLSECEYNIMAEKLKVKIVEEGLSLGTSYAKIENGAFIC